MKSNHKILLALAGGVLIGWFLTKNNIISFGASETTINPSGPFARIYPAVMFPQ